MGNNFVFFITVSPVPESVPWHIKDTPIFVADLIT